MWDRTNNRFQIFKVDGTFVKEVFVARNTLQQEGTVYNFAFSPDKEQRFLYVMDGSNKAIRVMNRQTLEIVENVGRSEPAAISYVSLRIGVVPVLKPVALINPMLLLFAAAVKLHSKLDPREAFIVDMGLGTALLLNVAPAVLFKWNWSAPRSATC